MRGLAFVAVLALSACAQPVALPASPVPAGPGITIVATAVPLNPQDPAQDHIGEFRYAGGLVLAAPDTTRFHGLSDMAVDASGAMTAITDEGDLIEARIVLDKTRRLVGLTHGRISPLANPEGKPLQGKLEGDAEGMALLANGDLLVSFEQRHRIWRYPASGGPPRPAPLPVASFPDNGGLEALGPDPAAGPDAYVAGAEASGQTWMCKVSTTCTLGPVIAKTADFGLVAVATLSNGRTAWLLRAWDPLRGNRVSLIVRDAAGEIARMDLARPLTIDNFEALAAVPAGDGAIRFYLLSDDNFQSSQRTLLVAFDWKPAP